MTSNRRASLLLCLVALATTTWSAARGQSVETADLRFVRGLMDRQLYGLAESYCLTQFDGAATLAEQAQWVLTLTDCWRHRSWQEQQTSRESLLKLSAARITEFLSSGVVPPGLELRLRLQQARCLVTIARQRRIVRRAAFQHRSTSLPRPDDTSATVMLETAEEITETLLGQLEEIKRDLDSSVVRAVRDDARLLLAQVRLLRGQDADTADAKDALLRQARELAETLVKGRGDMQIPLQAQIVQIEALRELNDLDAAQLRAEALRSRFTEPGAQLATAELLIELQLQHQRGGEALKLIETLPARAERVPQMSFLKCAACLAEFELIDRLDDGDMRGSSAQRCANAISASLQSTRGVWLEATRQVEYRFDRVRMLGVDAADLLSRTEQIAESGDAAQAAAQLKRLLQNLPAAIPERARGLLLARYGELLMQLDSTDEAQAALDSAVALLGDSPHVARVDLLRCFVLGQQWRRQSESAELRNHYESALRQHVTRFPESASALEARKWLVLLLQNSSPLDAVDELLTLVRRADGDDERTAMLVDAAEILLEPAVREPESPRFGAVCSRLRETATAFAEEPGLTPINRAVAIGCSALVALDAAAPGTFPDDSLAAALRSASDDLADFSGTTTAAQKADGLLPADVSRVAGWALTAQLIIDSQEVGTAEELQSLVVRLTEMPTEQRRSCVRILSRFLQRHRTTLRQPHVLAKAAAALVPAASSSDVSLEGQFARVEMTATLAAVAGEATAFENELERLLGLPGTDDDWRRTAAFLQELQEDCPGLSAVTPSLTTFWNDVLKRSPSGSDPWLEASLQLAEQAWQKGDPGRTRRIMDLVEIVAPEWGNSKRLARARGLRQRLSESAR